MVVGVPETFCSDVSTGNLATATSLDRPTELVFLERQEAWREDLVIIGEYVLEVSARAANGKLREALNDRRINPDGVIFRECARVQQPDGRWVYVEEAVGKRKRSRTQSAIEVKCTFPSIREGDVPALVGAVVQALTLGNKMGSIVGIDEKKGIGLLFEYLGVENGAELLEEMYPEGQYDPERGQEDEPAVTAAPTAVTPPAPEKPPTNGAVQPPTEPPALPKGHIGVRAHSEKAADRRSYKRRSIG